MANSLLSLSSAVKQIKSAGLTGPIALILCEDPIEIVSTVRHHLDLGFHKILLGLRSGLSVPGELLSLKTVLAFGVPSTPFYSLNALTNVFMPAFANTQWLAIMHNAEYFFAPFTESRSILDVAQFCHEERRSSIFTPIIDLYADDFTQSPYGVNLNQAYFDTHGYFALDRWQEGQPLERQTELYGGLHLRFEEHILWDQRQIGRCNFFRVSKGLQLSENHCFNLEEMNTHQCPWHRSLTGAFVSFRAAKALRNNPGSRRAIQSFHWQYSEPFEWQSQQLTEIGLMEPGQWV